MELHVQNHFWVVHPLLPNTMQLIWHESSAAMYSSFDSPGQLDSHPLGSTDTSRYAGRTDSPTRSQVKRLDGIENRGSLFDHLPHFAACPPVKNEFFFL